ncbi:MAG TPA: TlpA disulfide reductase family protein [Candidatus Sulfopaludibacter sp.]|jgi:thiol-disulfide isomerase/thioredoxin|nr:TlpA disulfide reductase family protein [Candidatus Sulfopaludibacter sp.]
MSSSLAILAILAGGLAAQQLPRKSPEFQINMTGGKQPILLSNYKGKVIVLAGILTTCPHCQHSVTLLSKLQSELGPRGLQVIACAIQEAPDLAVPLFIKQFNPPFPVGYSTDVKGVLDYFQYSPSNLPKMPMLAFIDRQFTIRAQHQGGEEAFFGDPQQEPNLRSQIEALLKEPATKRTVSKAVAPKKGN